MRMLTEVYLDHKHGFDIPQTKQQKEDASAAARVQQNAMTGRRPKTPEGKGTKRNRSPLHSARSGKSDRSDGDESGMTMGSADGEIDYSLLNNMMNSCEAHLQQATKSKIDQDAATLRHLQLQEDRLKLDKDRQNASEVEGKRMSDMLTSQLASNASTLAAVQRASEASAEGVQRMGAGIEQIGKAAANAPGCKQQ